MTTQPKLDLPVAAPELEHGEACLLNYDADVCFYRDALSIITPLQEEVERLKVDQAARQQDEKLWLWKNGDHFLAFRHPYPCFAPGGDPMVLGEPVGYAIVRQSFDRSSS